MIKTCKECEFCYVTSAEVGDKIHALPLPVMNDFKTVEVEIVAFDSVTETAFYMMPDGAIETEQWLIIAAENTFPLEYDLCNQHREGR